MKHLLVVLVAWICMPLIAADAAPAESVESAKEKQKLLNSKVSLTEEKRELGFIIENLVFEAQGDNGKFSGVSSAEIGSVIIEKFECKNLKLAEALTKLCSLAKCEFRIVDSAVQLGTKENFAAIDSKKAEFKNWPGPQSTQPSGAAVTSEKQP
jgi:hypothetical protein